MENEKKSDKTQSLLKEIWQHKLILFIVLCATLLRVWHLNTQMIFFGDAAHDLLIAKQALQDHSLPLLGIPSSVPRFRQGPVAIWLEMVGLFLSGNSLLFVANEFAIISVLAIIFLYELLIQTLNQKAAVIASMMLAFSPLAVAHGRVPYHITPIPFFLIIYFWSLHFLWEKKSHAFFWAVFSFCLLFQFELALTPLILLIPFVLWRKKISVQKKWGIEGVCAAILGLAPQLAYDATHYFAQLGGFVFWIVYRIIAFFGYKHDHTFSLSLLQNTFGAFRLYFTRIWSVDVGWLAAICFVICFVGFCLVIYKTLKKESVPHIIQITVLSTFLLILADIVLGSASEAYFPPFFIFTAILFAYTSEHIWRHIRFGNVLVVLFLLFFAIFNSRGILDDHFFVSSNQAFNYGSSLGEQREVVHLIDKISHHSFMFRTLQEGGKFPTYFDNLRWISAEIHQTEDEKGRIFFIEPKNSPLQTYPGIIRYSFSTLDVYTYDH